MGVMADVQMGVMADVQNLLIVSSAIHYRHGGRLFAYGAYAREIDIWADLFPRVSIAAPCRDEEPPGDCLPLTRANVEVVPQWETGGNNFRAKAARRASLSLPRVRRAGGTAVIAPIISSIVRLAGPGGQ